jgi:D-glycero-D-manno-heptose 1,7-bisphosphate phosphatase
MSWLTEIDQSWTLFLDRDGVINEEISGDYVRSADQFIFLPKAIESIAELNAIFGKTIVVTNQRCVGRGIITEQALQAIHAHMIHGLSAGNARIDAIYYAPDIDAEALMRKPNIGMALKAKQDFKTIDFSKSIMVGNSPSDIAFGKNAGMKTVFVETTKPGKGDDADIVARDLYGLVQKLWRSTDN